MHQRSKRKLLGWKKASPQGRSQESGIWATRRRTVIKAVSICGDETLLAAQLGVPVSRGVNMILGESLPTTNEFLTLVDIVLEDHRKAIERNKDWVEDIRKRYSRK
jgi:hypothetical protein